MTTPLIRYDDALMREEDIGKGGVRTQDIQKMGPRLKSAKNKILHDWKNEAQGWLGCPDDRVLVKRIQTLVNMKKGFETLLVIGIGGSDLGARAAYQALRLKAKGMKLEFLGANTDPDEIEDTLSRLNLKKTLVNVISKSGDTIEPMVTFLVVRERLQKVLGKRFAKHIVATTDESKGSLLELSQKEGYAILPVPQNIGGRFSVLSAVGLFPLACAGISMAKLLGGAATVRDAFLKEEPHENDAARYAAFHCLLDVAQHRRIHVLMPYSSRLESFGRWYRQLWAESLGKTTQIGPTPIAALGATDQHSQIQLYVEGPEDKIVTFLEVERFDTSLKVPTSVKLLPALGYTSGISFERIIHAERRATARALEEAGRPSGTLLLSKITSESVGALFLFFEIAVAVAGELYGINAYNQPGVESGKRAMREILGE
jgi:glucose-6-phosphate isomerase